jgi:transposase
MPRVALAIEISPLARAELARLARAPSTPQALALRARLVLAASQGFSNLQIADRFHVTPNTVGKWRTRYYMHGVSGLTDYQHPGRPTKYGPEVRKRLHDLLRRSPPSGRERWSIRELAQALGIPPSTMHEILADADFGNRRRPVRRRPRY